MCMLRHRPWTVTKTNYPCCARARGKKKNSNGVYCDKKTEKLPYFVIIIRIVSEYRVVIYSDNQ